MEIFYHHVGRGKSFQNVGKLRNEVDVEIFYHSALAFSRNHQHGVPRFNIFSSSWMMNSSNFPMH